MIDNALIQGVQKIANYRIKKSYPLMGETHYSESDIKWILESLAMILEEYNAVRPDKQIIIETMDINEAKVFVKFLKSEMARHQMDIDNARDLIYEVCFKYKIADLLEG
uniref:Uncharacterized protein n=1 Tax=viral metagenome TaxID=1070528 RepID=A0A6M3LH72_9ZZZZ